MINPAERHLDHAMYILTESNTALSRLSPRPSTLHTVTAHANVVGSDTSQAGIPILKVHVTGYSTVGACSVPSLPSVTFTVVKQNADASNWLMQLLVFCLTTGKWQQDKENISHANPSSVHSHELRAWRLGTCRLLTL